AIADRFDGLRAGLRKWYLAIARPSTRESSPCTTASSNARASRPISSRSGGSHSTSRGSFGITGSWTHSGAGHLLLVVPDAVFGSWRCDALLPLLPRVGVGTALSPDLRQR